MTCLDIEFKPLTSDLDDDEKNTIALTDGTPGNPNKTIISECDVQIKNRFESGIMIKILKNIKGLKPCPFCGNENPVIVQWNEKQFTVICGNKRYCSCEMGDSVSINGVKKIWNRRRYNEN